LVHSAAQLVGTAIIVVVVVVIVGSCVVAATRAAFRSSTGSGANF